jgi:para-aminobenzoate synthetase component 1
VLPGVMSRVVCRYLAKKGYEIADRRLSPEDLFAGGEVLLTNSLMGAVPVLELDGKACPPPSDLCQRINEDLLFDFEKVSRREDRIADSDFVDQASGSAEEE